MCRHLKARWAVDRGGNFNKSKHTEEQVECCSTDAVAFVIAMALRLQLTLILKLIIERTAAPSFIS
jgi:hypothetical protein